MSEIDIARITELWLQKGKDAVFHEMRLQALVGIKLKLLDSELRYSYNQRD